METRAFVCAGAVRVGLVDKEVVVNPTRKDLRTSSLNLVLAANENKKVGWYCKNDVFAGLIIRIRWQ